MPNFERRDRTEGRNEREGRPDSRAERFAAAKAEFARAQEDADAAGKALQSARAYAESHDGRHDPASKRELESIGKDADGAMRRFEALRKKIELLENPGEFEGAIAEDIVTKAVVSAVVPEPLAAIAEVGLTAAKAVVEAETEETPEERRRRMLREKKEKE